MEQVLQGTQYTPFVFRTQKQIEFLQNLNRAHGPTCFYHSLTSVYRTTQTLYSLIVFLPKRRQFQQSFAWLLLADV